MRARLGIWASGLEVELREVVLRDKPDHMRELSPKATVPVLWVEQKFVLDESLEIMVWALKQQDPMGWLAPDLDAMLSLISRNDQEFKYHLDRYKYPPRYDNVNALEMRDQCEVFLQDLEKMLRNKSYLFGDNISLADMAILPFVRQFAFVDKAWFDQSPYENVKRWLEEFLASNIFNAVMHKYPQWQEGDEVTSFKGSGF